jgi:hypothetical protein
MQLLNLRALVVGEIERFEHRPAEPARSATSTSSRSPAAGAASTLRANALIPASVIGNERAAIRTRAPFDALRAPRACRGAMRIDDHRACDDRQTRGRRQNDVLHISLLSDEAFRQPER